MVAYSPTGMVHALTSLDNLMESLAGRSGDFVMYITRAYVQEGPQNTEH